MNVGLTEGCNLNITISDTVQWGREVTERQEERTGTAAVAVVVQSSGENGSLSDSVTELISAEIHSY